MSHTQVILLADDDANDRLLLRRAFEKAGVVNPVFEVCNGAQAIAYLDGQGAYADRGLFPFPRILLLDMNMPEANGLDVLQWIRSKLTTQGLLIIVLSAVQEVRQVNRAYALGANSFLIKPSDEESLNELIHAFRDYWILRNKPPTGRTSF
jgi:CheY-like chemotaxis protein